MTEFLIFNAGTCELALPVSNVREVVRAASLSNPAGASPGIAGLLNVRGQVVSVVDLLAVAGVAQPPLSDTDFLIILGRNDERPCVLRAVGEVQLTSDAEPVDADGRNTSGVISGLICVGSRIVSVLSVQAISSRVVRQVEQEPLGGGEA